VLDAVGEDGQPASQAELSRQMHEWAINAEQGLCSAKACGHEPGGIERPLEQARHSVHDWRAILRDFIAATNPSDYRWAPPNRRFVASALYLPSVERSGVGDIVIVVDTSGSIGTQELEQFAGEINAITNEAQPESIRVILPPEMAFLRAQTVPARPNPVTVSRSCEPCQPERPPSAAGLSKARNPVSFRYRPYCSYLTLITIKAHRTTRYKTLARNN
jgi:hypothetical protein